MGICQVFQVERRKVMAGTIVHLVIADMIAKEIRNGTILKIGDKPFKFDADYFVAGNICPDGIMARKNYVREMKKHTHFRDGIRDNEFYKEENLAVFHDRLDKFFQDNINRFEEDTLKSLYLGYYIHMLTDEHFMLKIRPLFMEKISVLGLTQNDTETFRYFSHDVDMVDFKLINNYSGIKDIYNCLSDIKPYEIYDMITEEELTDSRKWILGYFFEKEHDGNLDGDYLKYDTMWEFIIETRKILLGHIDELI